MFRTSNTLRAHAARCAFRAAVLPILLSACSKDSTSPTPVATNLSVSSGASQSATVATALGQPVAVLVTDQNSNPLAGVSVQFAPNAGSGTVATVSVTTDANGIAQTQWTLGTVAGTDSLIATVGTLSTTIVATATADAPAQLTIVSGNAQSGMIDSTLAAPLVVRVTDRFGNPVANAAVQWSDDSGGALTTVTTMTDANGLAQVGYTLGATPGTEDVVATIVVGGLPVTADFTEQGS